MTGYPFTASATLLVLLVYAAFGVVVSRARAAYGVAAPAVTGNAEFERRYRVQMNTLEQMPILLPLLWLCAASVGDKWAALAGLVWAIGRVIYARAYYAQAAKRDVGFTISLVPILAMLLAVVATLAIRWA
jgi:glutathione S-transferase